MENNYHNGWTRAEEVLSPKGMGKSILRRKWMIIIFFGIVVGLAITILLYSPEVYE